MRVLVNQRRSTECNRTQQKSRWTNNRTNNIDRREYLTLTNNNDNNNNKKRSKPKRMHRFVCCLAHDSTIIRIYIEKRP